MAIVPILSHESAPDVVAGVYRDFQRHMGFSKVPNFIAVQGHSLAATQGTWDLIRNVLAGGALPRSLKEMLLVAISRDRNCRYCESAHLACCRMLGLDEAEALTGPVADIVPPKTRAVIEFGIKCARDPQSLTPEDFATLNHHGLSHSDVVETIAMSALAVYANIIADATGVERDDMSASA